KCYATGRRRGPRHRWPKTGYLLEERGVERFGALRGRPAGASEGVKTDLEGSAPAESDDADGLGEVPEPYPQAPGTRPLIPLVSRGAPGSCQSSLRSVDTGAFLGIRLALAVAG